MLRFSALFAATATIPAAGAAAAPTRDNVYALCTVRDVVVDGRAGDGRQMMGKIYRSSVFAVPGSYDDDVSLTPERGGKVSREFELWVWRTHGLRRDRMKLSDGDEHYCVEAPLTLEGKDTLTKLASEWDSKQFPQVDLVPTSWTRKKTAADDRFDAALADFEASLRDSRAAAEKYRQDLAAVEAQKARSAQSAQAALDQFARERASNEAEVARIAGENEAKRQAYREEYKRVTGRHPDQ